MIMSLIILFIYFVLMLALPAICLYYLFKMIKHRHALFHSIVDPVIGFINLVKARQQVINKVKDDNPSATCEDFEKAIIAAGLF